MRKYKNRTVSLDFASIEKVKAMIRLLVSLRRQYPFTREAETDLRYLRQKLARMKGLR